MTQLTKEQYAKQVATTFLEWVQYHEYFRLENGLWDSTEIDWTADQLNITTDQLFELSLKYPLEK